MKYEGIYDGNVVRCFPLKLKFQLDPGVRGFGYKVSVEVTPGGDYIIEYIGGHFIKILSIEPFEFDDSQKKYIEHIDCEDLNSGDLESFIEQIKTFHKNIEDRGGKDIQISMTANSYYDCDPEPQIKFTYKILETDEECYNRIQREENVKKELEERDRKLFESLKKRFGE